MSTTALTRKDIDIMTQDERWLGYGYLQGREIMLTSTDSEAPADPQRVANVERQILAVVNKRGWDYEQMFEWANSKNGRWFADSVYGCDESVEYAVRQGLL